MLRRSPDGVWFTRLSPVREASLVIPTIAAGARPTRRVPAGPRPASLAGFLAEQRALLVLDNMEQVVDTAPDIGRLLRAAPTSGILASSREPLAVVGERSTPSLSLAVPAEPGVPRAADSRVSRPFYLFVDRARSARPDFASPTRTRRGRGDLPPTRWAPARARARGRSREPALARTRSLPVSIIGWRLARSSPGICPTAADAARGDRLEPRFARPTERAAFRRLWVFTGGADFEVARR